MDLSSATAVQIRDAIRARKLGAEETTRFFLSRIASLDAKIGAFTTINQNAAADARSHDDAIARGEKGGPLVGVPIAIKDMLCTRALRTTAGSNALRNFIPPYDATVVARLRAAGAVVLGKTNQDEFAMGSSNETSAFGICRNPWNPEYVPGGSSGGSAACLAARMAPVSIGTDTGGSIRQPASFCGVVGMKPTYGRVSRYGIVAFASSLDQAGPMALTVRDCALILETIAGIDACDSTTSAAPVPSWTDSIQTEMKGVRIGVLSEALSDKVDEDTRRVVTNAIKVLKGLGAEVISISIPMLRYAVPIYYLIATSEASSNLARYDGVRYGHRSEKLASSLNDFYVNNRSESFGPEVKRRIMLGTYALSSGYYDAYYQKAAQVRRLLRDEYLKAFEKCDVIINPVTTSPAFKIGERVSDPLTMYLNDVFTTATNLAGLPGMSVPGGLSKKGLPIGVQLTARHFDEQSLFNVGTALEQTLTVEKRSPHVI